MWQNETQTLLLREKENFVQTFKTKSVSRTHQKDLLLKSHPIKHMFNMIPCIFVTMPILLFFLSIFIDFLFFFFLRKQLGERKFLGKPSLETNS